MKVEGEKGERERAWREEGAEVKESQDVAESRAARRSHTRAKKCDNGRSSVTLAIASSVSRTSRA